jgi:chromatin remodeling complex protein RSC6
MEKCCMLYFLGIQLSLRDISPSHQRNSILIRNGNFHQWIIRECGKLNCRLPSNISGNFILDEKLLPAIVQHCALFKKTIALSLPPRFNSDGTVKILDVPVEGTAYADVAENSTVVRAEMARLSPQKPAKKSAVPQTFFHQQMSSDPIAEVEIPSEDPPVVVPRTRKTQCEFLSEVAQHSAEQRAMLDANTDAKGRVNPTFIAAINAEVKAMSWPAVSEVYEQSSVAKEALSYQKGEIRGTVCNMMINASRIVNTSHVVGKHSRTMTGVLGIGVYPKRKQIDAVSADVYMKVPQPAKLTKTGNSKPSPTASSKALRMELADATTALKKAQHKVLEKFVWMETAAKVQTEDTHALCGELVETREVVEKPQREAADNAATQNATQHAQEQGAKIEARAKNLASKIEEEAKKNAANIEADAKEKATKIEAEAKEKATKIEAEAKEKATKTEAEAKDKARKTEAEAKEVKEASKRTDISSAYRALLLSRLSSAVASPLSDVEMRYVHEIYMTDQKREDVYLTDAIADKRETHAVRMATHAEKMMISKRHDDAVAYRRYHGAI